MWWFSAGMKWRGKTNIPMCRAIVENEDVTVSNSGTWAVRFVSRVSSSVRRVLRENVVAVVSFVWRWPFGDDKDAEALPCKGTTLLKVMFRFRSILCGLFHIVPQRVCEGRTAERHVSTVLHGPASFLYLSVFPSKLDQTAFFFVICGKTFVFPLANVDATRTTGVTFHRRCSDNKRWEWCKQRGT